jgi:hypothetical protein
MSHDVQACNRRKGSGRVTPSKWRRTAVVAADGVLAVGAGAMAGLFGAGAASAAAPTPGWTGLQSPTPVGLNAPAANPGETFSTDACASAVSCVTAGGYFDGTTERGLLDALYRGSWSSVEAPLPPDANASPDVRFFDSTCAASDSCFAVGGYDNSMSGTHPEGLIESWAGGVWTATEAPLPADAAPAASADTWLKSVSCPAPGQCVAVGWYENDLSKVVGLIETLSNGTWTDMAAPQVADAATNQDVALTGLSCPAEGSCVADGIYTTSASGKGLEVLALSGGTWTASVAPLPMDAATGSNEYVGLNPLNELMGQNLSCAGSECEIGGFYHTMAGGTAPLLLRGTATTWTASSVGLPANAETGASESATLADTSCGFDGSCVAVGSYSDTSSRVRPLIASISTN